MFPSSQAVPTNASEATDATMCFPPQLRSFVTAGVLALSAIGMGGSARAEGPIDAPRPSPAVRLFSRPEIQVQPAVQNAAAEKHDPLHDAGEAASPAADGSGFEIPARRDIALPVHDFSRGGDAFMAGHSPMRAPPSPFPVLLAAYLVMRLLGNRSRDD